MMNSIDSEEKLIDYLERLVLIKFTLDERKKLSKEITKILEFFHSIDEVKELDKYEPLFHVHDIEGLVREDEIDSSRILKPDEVSENAVTEQGYIKAPRTLVE